MKQSVYLVEKTQVILVILFCVVFNLLCDAEAYKLPSYAKIPESSTVSTASDYTITDFTEQAKAPMHQLPPLQWTEHWVDHDSQLKLAFADDYVALYFDDTIKSAVPWVYEFISKIWQYSTTTFGPFGSDPRIYIVLHTGSSYTAELSNIKSFIDEEYENKKVIDFDQPITTGWNDEIPFNQDLILSQIAILIIQVARETGNWPAFLNEQFKFHEILVYDIYNGLNRSEDASGYKNQWLKVSVDMPRKNTFWLRDWFYPIYSKYGETKVINRFFDAVYNNWPRNGSDYVDKMNLGEFVHFWSGTAGEDLTSLAIQSFGWSAQDKKDLAQARVDYPALNYPYKDTQDGNIPQVWIEHWDDHDRELKLVYFDDDVVFYFDQSVSQSTMWPFKLLSEAWSYAKDAYGPLSEDQNLYIILHNNMTTCNSSKSTSYLEKNYEGRNTIDCGQPSWESQASSSMDTLIKNVALLILRNARGTGNWPGLKVSDWSMADILVYDIYRGLRMPKDADRWFTQMQNATEMVPEVNTYWFRDWYFPIYENYGGKEALNKYLTIVNTFWPHTEQDYTRSYDLGTMVHFWSGATGENLWSLAVRAFKWSAWNHRKYLKARSNYTDVKYADTYQNSAVKLPPQKWKEHWQGHEEDLTLVHIDSHIAVYFDPEMDTTITWPFEPLSQARRYAQSIYGSYTIDPNLYVVLHNDNYDKCRSSRGDSYITPEYENRTVVDCGTEDDIWKLTFKTDNVVYTPLDSLLYEVSRATLREAKGVGNWPIFDVSRWEMASIVTYDIYQGIGRTKEADKWLQKIFKNSINDPRENTFWIRDWFYPIYAKHGGATVLNRFLEILKLYWPKDDSGVNYEKDLKVGEFIHFWSGAAGVNLTSVAKKTFRWSSDYQEQLEEAIVEYPDIQYKDLNEAIVYDTTLLLLNEDQLNLGHAELLFKVHADEHTTIYFDSDVRRSVKWPFFFLSHAWQITKATYDTVRTTPVSNVRLLLHADKHQGCKTQLNVASNNALNGSSHIIDCGKDSKDAWLDDSPANKDDLIQEFSTLVQTSAGLTNGREPYNRGPFVQMMVFDTYLKLGLLHDAHRILAKSFNEDEIQSGGDHFWIRDWYLPIYTTYGGAFVLNNFMSLLLTNWMNRNSLKLIHKMNVGQLTHFWSGAAGYNLLESGQNTFGKNSRYQHLFVEAQKDFPQIRYLCYDCVFDTETNNSGNDLLVIALSVTCSFVVLISILIPLLVYRSKIHNLKKRLRELTPEEIQEFFQGSSKPGQNVENWHISCQPFNTDLEIALDNLIVYHDKVLGTGEYGLVLSGVLTNANDDAAANKKVAVKTVKPDVDISHFKALLSELKVLGNLGVHPNIVSLEGAHTSNIRNREVFVALEFCAKGDLLGYIQKNKGFYRDLLSIEPIEENIKVIVAKRDHLYENKIDHLYTNEVEAKIDHLYTNEVEAFSTINLVEWSTQISDGMAYIASKKVIHGDLAARNILLSADNVAKISDFGLSRQLVNYSNYMKTSKTPVPFRWMAIEALLEMKFSTESDVWAFGVTLYEIFSLGSLPYPGCNWTHEFVDQLVAGYRLGVPEYGNEDIYRLMMNCMRKEPSERITFPQIVTKFQDIQAKLNLEDRLKASPAIA